jgi:HMG (high mobility group) box
MQPPKKPSNAFILYRQALSKTNKNVNGKELSKGAGEQWKKETAEVRAYFFDQARKCKEEHEKEVAEYNKFVHSRDSRRSLANGDGMSLDVAVSVKAAEVNEKAKSKRAFNNEESDDQGQAYKRYRSDSIVSMQSVDSIKSLNSMDLGWLQPPCDTTANQFNQYPNIFPPFHDQMQQACVPFTFEDLENQMQTVMLADQLSSINQTVTSSVCMPPNETLCHTCASMNETLKPHCATFQFQPINAPRTKRNRKELKINTGLNSHAHALDSFSSILAEFKSPFGS